jgi:hypothetical protein
LVKVSGVTKASVLTAIGTSPKDGILIRKQQQQAESLRVNHGKKKTAAISKKSAKKRYVRITS